MSTVGEISTVGGGRGRGRGRWGRAKVDTMGSSAELKRILFSYNRESTSGLPDKARNVSRDAMRGQGRSGTRLARA